MSSNPLSLYLDPWTCQAKKPFGCFTTILQCLSSSWAPLLSSPCALLMHCAIYPSAPRAEWLRSTGRFGWVGTNCESHSREQLCVGVCQRPAMKAQRAAELPPTSLLQPVVFVWLFSGCNLDVSVSWGIRTPRRWTDTLCVTLEDFFLQLWLLSYALSICSEIFLLLKNRPQ